MESSSSVASTGPSIRGSESRIPLSPIERDWPARRYSILTEVLGPDFHGPSSSHTAAPQLIALDAFHMLGGVPDSANVTLYNSFATTGEGHRTPVAVTAGLLGIATTDPRTPEAVDIAQEVGLQVSFERVESTSEHPNTLVLQLKRGSEELTMKGISIGGGNRDIVETKRRGAAAA